MPLKTIWICPPGAHRRRRSGRAPVARHGTGHGGFSASFAADGATALGAVSPASRRLRRSRRGDARHERLRRVHCPARLPECRHAPILMQTSLDDMDSVNRAYNAGATDFSSKGINPMLLAQRVKFSGAGEADAGSITRERGAGALPGLLRPADRAAEPPAIAAKLSSNTWSGRCRGSVESPY